MSNSLQCCITDLLPTKIDTSTPPREWMLRPSPTLMATVLVFLKVFGRRRATIESTCSGVKHCPKNPIPDSHEDPENKVLLIRAPYSPSGNFTSNAAAMSDLAIQANDLFLELDSCGEALFPCGRLLGSAVVGEGEVAGAEGRLWGLWLGVPSLPAPFPPPLRPLRTILGGFGGCLGFLAFSLLAFQFITLALFYVALVLVVATFATRPTGDGTPEVILMVHCFSIFSVLLSVQLQHASTSMIGVRGMTRPPLVIYRFTVEECGYTCFGLHLIHGTWVTPTFTPTVVRLRCSFGPS